MKLRRMFAMVVLLVLVVALTGCTSSTTTEVTTTEATTTEATAPAETAMLYYEHDFAEIVLHTSKQDAISNPTTVSLAQKDMKLELGRLESGSPDWWYKPEVFFLNGQIVQFVGYSVDLNLNKGRYLIKIIYHSYDPYDGFCDDYSRDRFFVLIVE